MNKMIKMLMIQYLMLISLSPMQAGSWDTSFASDWENDGLTFLEPLGYEQVTSVTTLGTDVYVGTTYNRTGYQGSARVLHFNESNDTWSEIATLGGSTDGTDETGVYALSAVVHTNGVKVLFVGGNFDDLTYSGSNHAVSNVVALNLSGSAIDKMGVSTNYGTSGPVYALKAFSLEDYGGNPPMKHPALKCLVGGVFQKATVLTVNSFAQWQNGLLSGWSTRSANLFSIAGGALPVVRSIEATTAYDEIDEVYYIDAFWVGGAFKRHITGSNTNYNIISTGSGSYNYIGHGFMHTEQASEYTSTFATEVALAGTNVFWGGFSDAHRDSTGTVHYDGGSLSGLLRMPKTSTIFTSYFDDVVSVNALAVKGTDLYMAGSIVDNGNTFNFAKLTTGGTLTTISAPTSDPNVVAAASNSSYVYFAGGYWVERYNP